MGKNCINSSKGENLLLFSTVVKDSIMAQIIYRNADGGQISVNQKSMQCRAERMDEGVEFHPIHVL